ncbi:hypothetical protein CBR_g12575 [Chara braunii]|uniref:ACT domain-containing protein n=1 Tax=Chara braunii TaxID=69332 RepID=A0A388KS37_CHABU|nr:hypothetical protein CBR_g12575 [Chara braunii]|eukprot:GBG72856.1 hypothetical protein CBR_g12575 [Chara braunii]
MASSSSSSTLHLDSNDLLFKTLPTNVAIDNKADTTVIRVNSANRQGCLLRIVQLLTEADLNVHKAFITSDGYWFVDDFRVTGPTGCKIENPDSMKQIEQLLEERSDPQVDEWERASILGRHDFAEYTAIEVTGRDRVGLLREIMSVLARVDVTIADATVWTNFGRMACVLYVMDANTEQPILDERRLGAIQELVSTVMEADDAHESRTTLTPLVRWKGQTWTERRLHQMMFDDRDFVSPHLSECGQLTSPVLTHKSPRSVSVKVENVPDYQYTMISVKSSDRARVLFDTVCTLADMEYDICHAYLKAEDGVCDQEYFIKTLEGKMVTMKTEHVFLEKCLEAAIRRRDCQVSLQIVATFEIFSELRRSPPTIAEVVPDVFELPDAAFQPRYRAGILCHQGPWFIGGVFQPVIAKKRLT